MEVIRFRKNNDFSISLGDSGRTEIQRDFLVAVLEECLQPDVLLKLPTLANIFLENVDTDLSVGNILAFAELAIGMDPETDVTIVSMPWTGVWYNGASMVVPIEDELLEILNDGINPYVDDIQSSDLQLMYKKSDGSFGVTNGTLADPSMGRAQVSTNPQPEQPEEPEVPVEPETPDQSGSSSQGTTPEEPVIPTDPTTPEEGGSGESSSQQPGQGENNPDGSGSSGETGGGTSGSDPVIPGEPVIPGDGTEGGAAASGGSGASQGGSNPPAGGEDTMGNAA